jgi:hypothetical protein
MLELAVAVSWLTFLAYATWFVKRAKEYQPINPKDVYVLWTLHRQKANCSSLTYVCKLHQDKGIIGFKCMCGYEYESKRPIV